MALKQTSGAGSEMGTDNPADIVTGEADGDVFTHDLVAITPRLRTFARSLTHDAVAAEDLVQDTLLRAWRSRGSFVLGSNLRAWTFTILKRLHLSNRRRLRFSGAYSDAIERSLTSEETQSHIVYLHEVEAAMSQLSQEQNAAIRLIAIEQMTYEEVSACTGLPVGTVKSRVARARASLVRLMAPNPAPAEAAYV